jgi:hypothetical protein
MIEVDIKLEEELEEFEGTFERDESLEIYFTIEKNVQHFHRSLHKFFLTF